MHITLPDTILFMIPQLFLAYSLMYWVIPRLVIPARYTSALFATLLLILVTAFLSAAMSVTLIDYVRYIVARSVSPVIAQNPHTPLNISIGLAMLAGLRGAITIGGVAAAIKLIKCVYEKQQAALLLEKEKVNAELRMLKAQLHPHFLFNTLNNIYSLTQEVSSKASGMIMQLSAMLRYILYECNKPWVPLDKELQMVRDYLQLEAARYDDSLDLSINLPADTNLFISPLLLLPFVENAFKHGASNRIERPWISIHMELNEKKLTAKIINGTANQPNDSQPGIGIANVRQRLALLYPNRHTLQTTEEEDIFIVNLRIELHDIHEQPAI